MKIQQLLAASPVIPVLNFTQVDEALQASQILVDAGIKVLEITLRHANALDCLTEVKAAFPECLVGAGTVISPALFTLVADSGADFAVSPGLTPQLAQAAQRTTLPLLPGIATLSEAMQALEQGFEAVKVFPAEIVGGIPLLQALYSVLPQIRCCPTGGINPINATNYLALPNVPCVGGSWLIKRDSQGQIDLAALTTYAQQAQQWSSTTSGSAPG